MTIFELYLAVIVHSLIAYHIYKHLTYLKHKNAIISANKAALKRVNQRNEEIRKQKRTPKS